jgi:hypothetical protein
MDLWGNFCKLLSRASSDIGSVFVEEEHEHRWLRPTCSVEPYFSVPLLGARWALRIIDDFCLKESPIIIVGVSLQPISSSGVI